jgi:hypothetical protein
MFFHFLAQAVFALWLLKAHAIAQPIHEARAAFMQNDFTAATRAYHEVLASDTVRAHRVEAATSLASYAWRLHRDTTTAMRLLADIERAIPDRRFPAIMQRARMLRESGLFEGARREARAALAAATTRVERLTGEIAYAEAVIKGNPPPSMLDSTIAKLRRLVRDHPGVLQPAELLIHAGAQRAHVDAVREGWRSYYLITGDTLSGPLVQPRRMLARTRISNEELARALADSKLFAAAALLIPPQTNNKQLSGIRAYAEFVENVRRVTDEYYGQIAIGNSTHDQWRATLDSLARALWPQLDWPGEAPTYSFELGAAELQRRYGAVYRLGRTAGQRDMHYGHAAVDTRRTVRQHGREMEVSFVALDAMVSNGYQSWAWDGRAAHGGWGGAEQIVQVRPNYVEEPIAVWAAMNDTTRAGEARERLRADSTADLIKGRRDSIGYFPSVAVRMERDGRIRLANALRARGLSGRALEAAFVAELGRADQESSIFAHEGRHAIDARFFPGLRATEQEYRAKLSEIAFAPHPRLALAGILSPNTGDATPHGQANERVMVGLHQWMRQHQSEIAGLNPQQPLLPQLPLLTDEQLRAAAAALDPMAREN